MAEPKLEIERRMERVENTILAMLKSQTGFGEYEAKEIEKILRGEKTEEPKEDIGSLK